MSCRHQQRLFGSVFLCQICFHFTWLDGHVSPHSKQHPMHRNETDSLFTHVVLDIIVDIIKFFSKSSKKYNFGKLTI